MNRLSTALLAVASLGAAPLATPEDAVREYFAGVDQCSGARLRRAFHPAAHLQWVDEQGKPQSLSLLSWWQKVERARPCQPAQERSLRVVDREGGLAMVDVEARYATHRFRDLLLLVETPDGWKIVDKVFQRLAPQETPAPADEAAIRRVVAEKIEAHAAYDPALLASSHLPECAYTRVHVEGVPFARVSLSEAAARYAAQRERGETDRESPWRVLLVSPTGTIAAVKLDVLYRKVRYIDHLLLLRTADGWRIAAAAWGDPGKR